MLPLSYGFGSEAKEDLKFFFLQSSRGSPESYVQLLRICHYRASSTCLLDGLEMICPSSTGARDEWSYLNHDALSTGRDLRQHIVMGRTERAAPS